MSSCCRQDICMKVACLVHNQYSNTLTHFSVPLVLPIFFFLSLSVQPPATMVTSYGNGYKLEKS